MRMPSTLLCAGLLLLIPAPFVRADPQRDHQTYRVNNEEDDYFNMPSSSADRYKSFRVTRTDSTDDSSTSSGNFMSQGKIEEKDESPTGDGFGKLYVDSSHLNDDIRQAIRKTLSNNDNHEVLNRASTLDDDEPEADNNSNNNNDYESIVGHWEMLMRDRDNKRSALGKRLKTLNENVREHYMRMFAPNGGFSNMRELKRERHGGGGGGVGGSGSGGGGGTTLSVESPMDLIRQRLMQELRRRELVQKQRQIQTNDELLSSIGKRSGWPSGSLKTMLSFDH